MNVTEEKTGDAPIMKFQYETDWYQVTKLEALSDYGLDVTLIMLSRVTDGIRDCLLIDVPREVDGEMLATAVRELSAFGWITSRLQKRNLRGFPVVKLVDGVTLLVQKDGSRALQIKLNESVAHAFYLAYRELRQTQETGMAPLIIRASELLDGGI